jgi:hypothetical protein
MSMRPLLVGFLLTLASGAVALAAEDGGDPQAGFEYAK